MGRISDAQRQQLYEIARLAYGSGLTEGTSGGRGYMGLDVDFIHGKYGKTERRAFKFLTHRGESTKSITERQWRQLDAMTSCLRDTLLAIAQGAGDEVEERVRDILKLDDDWEPTAETPRLLERKVVAKAVTEIAKADKGPGSFAWELVDGSRARTLADTSVSNVLSALGARDGMPPFAKNWLVDFAKVAYGSGKGEGANGGRGCMGVFVDEKGREHVVKFLTHSGESTKDLLPWQWKEIDKMTDLLRHGLLSAAEYASDETLRKVQAILKVDEKDRPTAETPRLLERKVVAQAISVIMDANNIANGGWDWDFSWEKIAEEPREPSEKDMSPAVVLDRLGAKREAIGEGWTVLGEGVEKRTSAEEVEFHADLIRHMPDHMDRIKGELRQLRSNIMNFRAETKHVIRLYQLLQEVRILEIALKDASAAVETGEKTRRKSREDLLDLSLNISKVLGEATLRMPHVDDRRPDLGEAAFEDDDDYSVDGDSEDGSESVLSDDDDQ